MPGEGSAVSAGEWVEVVLSPWQSGHRDSGAGDTTARLGQGPAVVGRSRKIPITLSDVTDQTGAERDDPREAGGHTVSVDVAGDEMVAEQT